MTAEIGAIFWMRYENYHLTGFNKLLVTRLCLVTHGFEALPHKFALLRIEIHRQSLMGFRYEAEPRNEIDL